MSIRATLYTLALLIATHAAGTPLAAADAHSEPLQLGPRPYFLIDAMDDGPLKHTLASCKHLPMQRQALAIGHRGAPLQFPEHTKESYLAAARTGAGVIECDVTFTADRELVCRHSQCDLHSTTNILTIPPLAAKCSVPFRAAKFDAAGNRSRDATARCCTTDITLAEFRQLQGKMDAFNPNATTVEQFLTGTAGFRTDLYSSHGTLMTHAESIKLFSSIGVKMTPELKSAQVDMPYQGNYTQRDYARQLIDEYTAAGVPASDVWPQSFNLKDIEYWIDKHPDFGRQAVYLDGRYRDRSFRADDPASWQPGMQALADSGVRVIAPPLWMLLTLDANRQIVPSVYATAARRAGLQIITWTLERSGPLAGGGGWYYQTIKNAIDNDGDMLTVLDVLVQDVGVIGVFSDWPATVSFYANCMDGTH